MRRPAWPLLLTVISAGAHATEPGDAGRGAAIVANRALSQCVLCHPAPGVPPHLRGDLGPDLAGVGARLTAEQLRQRLIAPQRFNPQTIMPAYGRREGLNRVAPAWRGRPLLDAQQIEDVVAYLESLR